MIDGQGGAFKGPHKVRPYLLRIIGCRDVSVRDVTLKDSAMWVQHYLACEGVRLDGITVTSKCNANNDGMDIDGCQRVRIANCDIQSGDDAIALKSTLDRPCRHVVVTNCILSSDCNAFKLGTESNGGFENILMSNCALYDTRLAGIALEVVDGGRLDGVSISHVTMQNVGGPIFIRLGNRGRGFKAEMAGLGICSLRNVSLSGIQAILATCASLSIDRVDLHGSAEVVKTNEFLTGIVISPWLAASNGAASRASTRRGSGSEPSDGEPDCGPMGDSQGGSGGRKAKRCRRVAQRAEARGRDGGLAG